MKWLLAICLWMMPYATLPKPAAFAKGILVYGDTMNMMFIITLSKDDAIDIRSIPTDTLVGISCANQQVSTLSNIKDEPCLISSLEASFPITITNVVHLHPKAIEEDFTLSKSLSYIQNFHDFQTYFHELGTQVSFSMLWKLHNYVDCDLALQDIIRFYQIYTADDFQISYYFLHLFKVSPTQWIALDTQFYPCSICT